jgi:DNA uptake protein ComE-like DNA-binding protein
MCIDFDTTNTTPSQEELAWLRNEHELDRMIPDTKPKAYRLYPFNPNFITDYKGYRLGMSVAEIDRLLAFRKQNRFVNSAAEFQQVTRVSDSLLGAIAPYFKFPAWVQHSKLKSGTYSSLSPPSKKVLVLDINQATKEELMAVYGIGDKLSDRILNQRALLGGFVKMEQLQDVWGLSPEVIGQLNQAFAVQSAVNMPKIPINTASLKELAQFPYFHYALAKEVVLYRSMHGRITIEDLSKIKGFPVDKINIIALYLEF